MGYQSAHNSVLEGSNTNLKAACIYCLQTRNLHGKQVELALLFLALIHQVRKQQELYPPCEPFH